MRLKHQAKIRMGQELTEAPRLVSLLQLAQPIWMPFQRPPLQPRQAPGAQTRGAQAQTRLVAVGAPAKVLSGQKCHHPDTVSVLTLALSELKAALTLLTPHPPLPLLPSRRSTQPRRKFRGFLAPWEECVVLLVETRQQWAKEPYFLPGLPISPPLNLAYS
jgi:hypothetical protein